MTRPASYDPTESRAEDLYDPTETRPTPNVYDPSQNTRPQPEPDPFPRFPSVPGLGSGHQHVDGSGVDFEPQSNSFYGSMSEDRRREFIKNNKNAPNYLDDSGRARDKCGRHTSHDTGGKRESSSEASSRRESRSRKSSNYRDDEDVERSFLHIILTSTGRSCDSKKDAVTLQMVFTMGGRTIPSLTRYWI